MRGNWWMQGYDLLVFHRLVGILAIIIIGSVVIKGFF